MSDLRPPITPETPPPPGHLDLDALRAVGENPIRRDGMCLLRASTVLALLDRIEAAEQDRDGQRRFADALAEDLVVCQSERDAALAREQEAIALLRRVTEYSPVVIAGEIREWFASRSTTGQEGNDG